MPKKKVEESIHEMVQESKANKQKKYKLANPDTQYAEPGFTLSGSQEKTLPAKPSKELLQRIDAGFIVEAE